MRLHGLMRWVHWGAFAVAVTLGAYILLNWDIVTSEDAWGLVTFTLIAAVTARYRK